jgi:hypothetical protein
LKFRIRMRKKLSIYGTHCRKVVDRCLTISLLYIVVYNFGVYTDLLLSFDENFVQCPANKEIFSCYLNANQPDIVYE